LVGAVTMTYDPQLGPASVVVNVGSVVSVTGQSASQTATAGPPTTQAVPTPGHQPITPAVTPLQSFDPTQCTPGYPG
jgi:hypothetical protein